MGVIATVPLLPGAAVNHKRSYTSRKAGRIRKVLGQTRVNRIITSVYAHVPSGGQPKLLRAVYFYSEVGGSAAQPHRWTTVEVQKGT